ncbi:ATP-binding protein [Actinoplanes sp. NPDC051494]|uniref:ATP-binding protein n=1 Tax=Actinoplanes sp. NPDC051494 TaxID=3363907 RepID=UPI0037B05C73
MPSEVRHLVDGGLTYPVVRLAGVLDAGSAPLVRSAVLGVLAGQPEAVVIDVRDLALGHPEAAEVLGELARGAAEWPGARLAVCAGGDTGAWRRAGLPIWPTPAAAEAALGDPSPERFLSIPLDAVVGAARVAREIVTRACTTWDVPELGGTACLVVTEMVNNVVAHARTEMTILLALHGDTISVAVRDRSADIPRFTGSPVPVTSYGGRGLLLIDSMARRWGTLALPTGKVMWATVAADEPVPDIPRPAGMAPHNPG